ncbi:MAG: cytochrome c biogenesis protein CcdA [Flavobacteriales bacterium]|nr:cytochrome c biogenesis protein CcdA [Flavobacteriales bacterium]
MRRLIIFFTALTFLSSAQIFDPVKWDFSQKKVSDTEIELNFKATIDDGWYIYSQDAGEGPVSTEFSFFNPSTNTYGVDADGVNEGVPIEDFDPNYDVVLKYFKKEALFTVKVQVYSTEDFVLKGEVYYMTCDSTQCLPPEALEFEFQIDGIDESLISSASKPLNETEEKSMWALFFIAFLSGFAALLTPCVFPMIPMTVSFFTKQSKTKARGIANAIIYGISIIVIYVALGVGVSSIFGADALNNMATNVYFNIGFFLLLLIFGASFLGAFELQLPTSWVNKTDKASDKGGLIGIFFMAFTLALVSFSCTGPIVGTLLVEASTGGYFGPIIGMLGFSLAIALPFAFFAAFPGWLNSLPQSGGWLNSVKVTLGFLEIALAFKFLSNADLVLQTHLLERELFIAIWIVIFALLTMYLLGFLKFAHDSDLEYISVSRFSVAILTGTLTIYMIPGLWGAPLKIINAFPPPMQYSESPQGVGAVQIGFNDIKNSSNGQHIGPQGLMVFHDYKEALEHAKKIDKPLMLDFTGHACVNCRKMEEQVWSDQYVKEMLRNDVVLVSLYVDERIDLPKDEQYTTMMAGKEKKVKTTGDKWMVLQANNFGTNSQPYYVMLDHNENQLIEPANYQDYGSVSLFKDWLERGVDLFNK